MGVKGRAPQISSRLNLFFYEFTAGESINERHNRGNFSGKQGLINLTKNSQMFYITLEVTKLDSVASEESHLDSLWTQKRSRRDDLIMQNGN